MKSYPLVSLPRLARVMQLSVFLVVSLILSGCSLQLLFGNVIYTKDVGETVDEIIATVFSDSTAAVCEQDALIRYDCTYIFNGVIVESTFSLVNELGLLGVLIDPVILQVPDDITKISATYDMGDGPQPAVVSLQSSVQITPSTSLNAEANSLIAIVQLPAAVAETIVEDDPALGPEISYALTFTRALPAGMPQEPARVKALFAVKVALGNNLFYIPVLPCVTDFADIPALEIPVSQSAVNLLPQVDGLLASNAVEPCNRRIFNYIDVQPLPERFAYLPMITR